MVVGGIIGGAIGMVAVIGVVIVAVTIVMIVKYHHKMQGRNKARYRFLSALGAR